MDAANPSPVGYRVLGFTQTAHTKIDPSRHYNPFLAPTSSTFSASPFPTLDPLAEGAGTTSRGADALVQLSRLHVVLEDASMTGSGPGFVRQPARPASLYPWRSTSD